ncbi:MAG: phosphoribosylglycinamide formyltransferase [Calditrichaeota bacterium]|nr:phosphoribosylglycinamide formyltransferase [Calditrichota bacterium]
MNLAVYLSGRGSNFEAILAAIDAGSLNAKIVLVVSNNPDAQGLRTAERRGIATAVFERDKFASGEEFAGAMLNKLNEHKVEFIALAGYMRKIPPAVIRAYSKRIVNIHPALLPKFGGKGMYGHFVHEAVIAAGEKETGVTIHYVDEIYDHGVIIAQCPVPVMPDDTPETLAQRTLAAEHKFYPEVLAKLFRRLK